MLPGQPDWSACDGVNGVVDCTQLEVPLDYGEPDSGSIHLAVRRLRATDEAERMGVLVTIAGGPGQRGTLGVWPGAHTDAIRRHFDIVSWDPRGTSGDSVVDCIPQWDPYIGLDRTPDTEAEREALDAETLTLASHCREEHGQLLSHVSTRDTALDLEQLRRMLDEPRISLLGSSYGSEVALTYATLFPDHVRAVVLDGYSDSNLSPGQREIEQAAAYERELNGLLSACADDQTCPFSRYGDPGPALDGLLAALDAAPLPAEGGRWLTQSDADEAIVGYLTRDRGVRQQLLAALERAQEGDGTPLLDIATRVRQEYEASGLTQGAFMAIYCADSAAWWQDLSPVEVAQLADRVAAVAPRLGRWLWSPPSAPGLPPVGLCAMRPPAAASPPATPIDAAGAGPVLVLASSGDPTTPVSAARRSLRDLEDASLVTLDADHHLAYQYALADPERPAHECVLDAVESYLLKLETPPAQKECTDDQEA